MSEYSDFLNKKLIQHMPTGFEVDCLNPALFDWQQAIVRWALYKGKAGLFEDCGLGKTIQQLEWANQIVKKTNGKVLILAPLAVSHQTKREGESFGIDVNICKTQGDVKPGINITNYEKLDHFYPDDFVGIVLDESSILKNFTGKTKIQIIESFLNCPYKLCATATPSPNDFTELGNTSEFLGVMTRPEMLSMFFINDTSDTGTWRLKGHASKSLFWKWISSWAIMMQNPSDIGFQSNFVLPELLIHEHVIPFWGRKETLFVEPATTLSERREARKESLQDRVHIAAEMVNNSSKNWLIWCNLNSESDALKSMIHDSVEVKGSDKDEHKEKALIGFQGDQIKCLITKPSIAGLGLNLQNCSNMAFVGLSDSYEQYYQAVRRCWRFGQKNNVNAHIITGEREGAVVSNIKRKEKDMQSMFQGMVKHMQELMRHELTHSSKTETKYIPKQQIKIPSFLEALNAECNQSMCG